MQPLLEPQAQPDDKEPFTTTSQHTFIPNTPTPPVNKPAPQPAGEGIDPPPSPPSDLPPDDTENLFVEDPPQFVDDAPPGIGGMPRSLQERYIKRTPDTESDDTPTRRRLDTRLKLETEESYPVELQKLNQAARLLLFGAYHKLKTKEPLSENETFILRALGVQLEN